MEPCPGDGRPFEFGRGEEMYSGFRLGRGPDVVVLSHQVRSSECDLMAMGARLAEEGFQVVAWTADPYPTAAGLEEIVRVERRRGAKRIVLAGASKGATMSLYLAAKLDVDAVVATELDTPVAGVPAQVEEAHDGREHVELIPDSGDHGRQLVWTRDAPVTEDVVAFLRPLLRG